MGQELKQRINLMGPGVDADFMTSHILLDKNTRPFDHARTDNKEGCGDVLYFEVIQ